MPPDADRAGNNGQILTVRPLAGTVVQAIPRSITVSLRTMPASGKEGPSGNEQFRLRARREEDEKAERTSLRDHFGWHAANG